MNNSNTPTVLFTKSEAVDLLDQACEKYGGSHDLILDRVEGVLFWVGGRGGNLHGGSEGEWRIVEVTTGLFAIVLIPEDVDRPTRLLTSDLSRVDNLALPVDGCDDRNPVKTKVFDWTRRNIAEITRGLDLEREYERFLGLSHVRDLDAIVNAYRQDDEDARIEEMNERRSFEIEDVVGKAFHD